MSLDTFMHVWGNFWGVAMPYLPFGIIGAWRWGWWLLQTLVASLYRPVSQKQSDVLFHPTLSLITPVYNEDPIRFARALRSWRQNKPDEIIAVIDESDQNCVRVFKEFARTYSKVRLIITDEPGKRPALARGIQAAQGEIVALVDSDTLWEPDIKDTMLRPFRDKRVGGVGPRQVVLDPKTLAQRLFAIRLNLRYLHELPYLAALGDALTCLSGRTALYRRSALANFLDQLVYETFLGQPCISGDDKRLTSLVQAAGWKTRYQGNARVWTHGMERMSTFLGQYIRWSRNSWRTDMQMLILGWLWQRERWLGIHLLGRFVSPFVLLLGPVALTLAIFLHQWFIVGAILLWWCVSRTLKLLPHLRESPRDLSLIPAYIIFSYVFSVLRIYALLTLDFQGWITRWDQIRLKHFSFATRLSAFLATLSTVMMFMGSVGYIRLNAIEAAQEARTQQRPNLPFDNSINIASLEKRRDQLAVEANGSRVARYVSRGDSTLEQLRDKYAVTPGVLGARYPGWLTGLAVPAGAALSIPVEYIRNDVRATTSTVSLRPPAITFDPATNTIHIKGSDSVVTLDTVSQLVPEGILERQSGNEWVLRSNIRVSENVTLILGGPSASRLRLASGPQSFISVQSYNGTILIRDISITSWDESRNIPDTDVSNGRSFIAARGNGRLDVFNSEIAYLGYPRGTVIPGRESQGAVYGLSWKIPNGTFGRALLTGNVIGNRIHDNYFGLYMFGATGMIVRDNEVFHNVQYGIDPHDDSNLLLIENNNVHDNGNHGIIVSKRVVHSIIRGNKSYNNRLHGIMLDRQSNNNLVENNTVFGNTDGLAIFDSHNNLVRNNRFERNKHGIRANHGSSGNYFESNSLIGNDDGLYIYGGANNNIAANTLVQYNIRGVYIKDSSGTTLIGNSGFSNNKENIRLGNNADHATSIQPF